MKRFIGRRVDGALLVTCLFAVNCGDDSTNTAGSGGAGGSGGEATGGAPTTTSGGGGSGGEDLALADGSPCVDSTDCASGKCYDGGQIGKTCGECEVDADCSEFGCNPPSGGPMGATSGSTCSDGSVGSGCETDAACAVGLKCAPGPLDVVGTTCGECLEDADCTDGTICAARFDFTTFSSFRECIPSNTLEDGEVCEVGSTACVNLCVLVMSPVGQLGVCAICETDADCVDGGTCVLPSVGTGGVVLGQCQI